MMMHRKLIGRLSKIVVLVIVLMNLSTIVQTNINTSFADNGTPPKNVALAANGGTVITSSTHSAGFPESSLIDGDRIGANWGNGGGWNDATADQYPDYAEVTFSEIQTINEIDVFTYQALNVREPTLDMLASGGHILNFNVLYWNGSGWVNVPNGSVVNNNKVWNKFTFEPVTTNKIKLNITLVDSNYSRVIEIEAWTGGTSSNQLEISANDASVDLAVGNKTVKSTNNTWTLGVSNGTVKSNVSIADLTCTGLPSGLAISAVKGFEDNTIIITVSGTAINAISETSNVNISVKGSAVEENGLLSSNAITVQLNPSQLLSTDGFTILNGTAIASSDTKLTVSTTISMNQGNEGMEYVIFELINGTTPEQTQIIPLNYESNPTATKGFKASFVTNNNLTSNYSVKIYVSNSDSVAGVELALTKAIPMILFSQLKFNDNSYIGIDDIIKFITVNSESLDINHDSNPDNEDIRILLDQISPVIEF